MGAELQIMFNTSFAKSDKNLNNSAMTASNHLKLSWAFKSNAIIQLCDKLSNHLQRHPVADKNLIFYTFMYCEMPVWLNELKNGQKSYDTLEH